MVVIVKFTLRGWARFALRGWNTQDGEDIGAQGELYCLSLFRFAQLGLGGGGGVVVVSE